jgi:hypothetical protein
MVFTNEVAIHLTLSLALLSSDSKLAEFCRTSTNGPVVQSSPWQVIVN